MTTFNFKDVTETSQKAIIGSPANGNFRVKEEPKDFYVSDVNLIKQLKSIKSPSCHFSGILCLLNQQNYWTNVALCHLFNYESIFK